MCLKLHKDDHFSATRFFCTYTLIRKICTMISVISVSNMYSHVSGRCPAGRADCSCWRWCQSRQYVFWCGWSQEAREYESWRNASPELHWLYCNAKVNSSSCSLEKWAVTAVCLCTSEQQDKTLSWDDRWLIICETFFHLPLHAEAVVPLCNLLDCRSSLEILLGSHKGRSLVIVTHTIPVTVQFQLSFGPYVV